jgi:methionyl-tRNA formyltransferase
MNTPSRLVFFGNERLVSGLDHTNAPVLTGLIERGYNVVAVVANHTNGTSRNARKLEVADIAEQHGIPLFLPTSPSDIIDELTAFKPDAAILVAYGRILSQRVINVFSPIGIINLHPSLLPRHRGPTPIESTILEGDEVAGVSVMQLTAGMDEGPVYAQVSLPLHGTETKFELYELLAKAGTNLLLESLPYILSGELAPKAQQNVDVSVTSRISKTDGVLDPTTDDATTIERKIRAYQGYPKPHLNLYDNDVIVTSAKVVDSTAEGRIVLPCANKTLLEVTSLIAPSGRAMSAEDFLRGYAKNV